MKTKKLMHQLLAGTTFYKRPILKNYHLIPIALLTLMGSCKTDTPINNPLEMVLASQNQNIKKVMDSVANYEVQIRYTQINRGNDSLFFKDFDYNVDNQNYFYPASTVKFPIAVLTLEKLNEDVNFNLHSKFYVEGDSMETTFAADISKIFVVSDNMANNRLFEFLGQDAITLGLINKGLAPVRISHRLSTPNADEVTTKPLLLYLNDSTTMALDPSVNSAPKRLQAKHITKGEAFYEEDSLISEAFDFSFKNYYPIKTQHGLLKRVIFPEKFNEQERFNLNKSQREYLLSAMHTLPKDLGYDPEKFYDSYGKFFIYGDSKENIPKHVEIYNKVGYAYGTLTDCAYILDTKNNIEFLLTATILVNKNGVFNDDTYEYETIGIPFLAELGREIYKYELNR